MQQQFTLRPVRASDVDAIASINVAVWRQDWNFAYRFPHAQEFSDDYFEYSRLKYEEAIQNVEQGIYSGIVAEAPSKGDATESEVAAFAFWRMPSTLVQDANSLDQKEGRPQRHANMERINAFRAVVSRVKKAWFDDKYGNRQLLLTNVIVHPDNQRYGIGTAILKWGMELAQAEKVPIVLFATPLGKKLYLRFGFESVGAERIQVEGEEEFLMLEGMVREVQ